MIDLVSFTVNLIIVILHHGMHNCHYKSQTKSSLSADSMAALFSIPGSRSPLHKWQVLQVILYLHLQFHRVALTAEQDFDAPSALTVHSLSLKHTLRQGQSQWGYTHEVIHMNWDFNFGLYWYFNYKHFQRGESVKHGKLKRLERSVCFPSYNQDNQALKTSILIEKPN